MLELLYYVVFFQYKALYSQQGADESAEDLEDSRQNLDVSSSTVESTSFTVLQSRAVRLSNWALATLNLKTFVEHRFLVSRHPITPYSEDPDFSDSIRYYLKV